MATWSAPADFDFNGLIGCAVNWVFACCMAISTTVIIFHELGNTHKTPAVVAGLWLGCGSVNQSRLNTNQKDQ